MKPGQFSLRLKEGAAWSLRSAIREFDHIVVMPGPFDPNAFSNANILSAAAYVGVVLVTDSKSGEFSGAGLAHWLGTSDGLGDILDTAVTLTAGTLTQWVTALCPSSLTVGTVTNTTTLTNTYQWCTRREALDDVCRLLSAEWSISTSFALSAGPIANLFTTAPVVMITDKPEGQDGAIRGLDGEMHQQVDVTKYATAVIVVAQGSGSTVATGVATSGATTYRDGLGNLVVMEGLSSSPTTPSASAAAAATAALAQFSSPARQVSVNSHTYGVSRFAKPGDSVYAFDLEAQLINVSQQLVYRGEVTTPITERVFAISWPVERGMSVFVRRSTGVGTFTYTDLTDAFEYEQGDVTWEVGAVDPSMSGDLTTIGTTAYLGANPVVQQRTTSGTPAGTIVASIAATAPSGWFILDGSTITNGQNTQPALWAVIPAGWKSGANIVLPDARGRTIVGAGTGSGLTARTLNSTFGAETVTLSAAESGLPAHNHSTVDGGHNHTQNAHGHATSESAHVHNEQFGNGPGALTVAQVALSLSSFGSSQFTVGAVTGLSIVANTATNNATTTGLTISNVAAAAASSGHANMQPSIALNWMVAA